MKLLLSLNYLRFLSVYEECLTIKHSNQQHILGLISSMYTTPVTLILSRLADYALIEVLIHSIEIAKACKRMYEKVVMK